MLQSFDPQTLCVKSLSLSLSLCVSLCVSRFLYSVAHIVCVKSLSLSLSSCSAVKRSHDRTPSLRHAQRVRVSPDRLCSLVALSGRFASSLCLFLCPEVSSIITEISCGSKVKALHDSQFQYCFQRFHVDQKRNSSYDSHLQLHEFFFPPTRTTILVLNSFWFCSEDLGLGHPIQCLVVQASCTESSSTSRLPTHLVILCDDMFRHQLATRAKCFPRLTTQFWRRHPRDSTASWWRQVHHHLHTEGSCPTTCRSPSWPIRAYNALPASSSSKRRFGSARLLSKNGLLQKELFP